MFIVEHFEAAKDWLVPKDQSFRLLLHVHVGLMIYISVALLSRQGLSSASAVLILLSLECVNEVTDMWGHWSLVWSWRWRDVFSDIASTMFWPIVLYLIARSQARQANN